MHEHLCYDSSSVLTLTAKQLTALDILDYVHLPQTVITGFRFLVLGE